MFVWSSENYKNATYAIDLEYGTNITVGTVTLGSLCTIMNFSGIVQDFVLQDIALFVILTMHAQSQITCSSLSRLTDEFSAHEDLENDWKKCTSLKMLSDSANAAFGITFKLLHISNLFSITLVLLQWLKNKEIETYTVVMTLHTFKIITFYFMAVKTSEDVSP